MLAACFQAMIHRHRKADAMAAQAFIYAALHFGGYLVHLGSPSWERRDVGSGERGAVPRRRQERETKLSRRLTAFVHRLATSDAISARALDGETVSSERRDEEDDAARQDRTRSTGRPG